MLFKSIALLATAAVLLALLGFTFEMISFEGALLIIVAGALGVGIAGKLSNNQK